MTNEQFEILAALYYKRFGRLAPGKDEPAASNRDSGEIENVRQFIEWKGGAVTSAAIHDLIEELISEKAETTICAKSAIILHEALERVDIAEWIDLQVKYASDPWLKWLP